MKLKFLIAVIGILFAMPSYAQFTTGGGNSNSSNNYGSSETYLHKGYRGIVDFGYGIGVGDLGMGRIQLATTHGYQFNPYLYAGVGVCVNYYHEGEAFNVPIFADIRGTLPIRNTKIAPLVDMRIGYSVADVEGFYFNPSVGIRLGIGNNAGISFAIGYELQSCETIEIYYGYGGYWYEEGFGNTGAVTLRLGFDF